MSLQKRPPCLRVPHGVSALSLVVLTARAPGVGIRERFTSASATYAVESCLGLRLRHRCDDRVST